MTLRTKPHIKAYLKDCRGVDYVGYDSQWSYYAVYPYLVLEIDADSKIHPMARQIIEEIRPIAEEDIEGNPIIIKLRYEI